jgi:diguanylate cyclase (GGDEF)-like protein/PAS domain S-box-containing protein
LLLEDNQRDAIIEMLRHNKAARNIDITVRTKDGSVRNGLFSADTVYIGKDLCLLTVMVDITERRQAEEELAMERRRLTDILAGTNVGTWEWNIQTGEIIFNERWAGIIGYTLNELAPVSIETWIKFVHPDDLKRSEELLGRHFKGELDYYEMEARMRHKNGNWIWVLDRGKVAIRTEDGEPLLMSGTHQDITERKQNEELLKQANEQLLAKVTEIEQLQDELREQALRDPLTGLYNRRYLSETLNREAIRTKRAQQSLSIITMDVDHFKKVNDTCGHQVGDLFLKEVANLIKNHARGYDFVCRYGGEEFLMVLPGASTVDAVTRADEIRQRCAAFIVIHEGKELHVTISMGVATYPNHDMDIERVIVKADQALYHSKNSGRNRVTTWNEHQITME